MQDYFDEAPKPKYSNNLPRAKLFLRARLGWLWGYPLVHQTPQGLSWQTLYVPGPWDQEIRQLQAEDLAQAAYSYQRLVHAFPRALPQLVGSVELWEKRVSLKLQALRALLENKTIQPWQALLLTEQGSTRLLRQVNQLKRHRPTLMHLLDAWVWCLSLDPKRLEQAVEWLEQEQIALSQILENFPDGIKVCLLLFTLSQELSTSRTSNLVNLLANPVWQVEGALAYKRFLTKHSHYFEGFPLQAAAGKLDLPALPALSEAAETWQVWLVDLMSLPTKERRRLLDLVTSLLNPTVLDAWKDWHQHSQLFLAEFKGLASQYYKLYYSAYSAKQKKGLQKQFNQEVRACWLSFKQNEMPLVHKLNIWLADLKSFGQETALTQALSSLEAQLQRLPATSLWRQAQIILKVLQHWQLGYADTQHSYSETYAPRRFKLLVQVWLSYLKDAASAEALEARLKPWSKLIDYYAQHQQHGVYLLESSLRYKDIEGREADFFSKLGQLCECEPEQIGDGFRFYHFYETIPAHWPCLDYFRQTLASEQRFEEPRLVAAFDTFLAADPSAEHFKRLLTGWQSLENENSYSESLQIIEVLAYLQRAGYQDIHDSVRLNKPWFLVLKIAELLPLLKSGMQVLPSPLVVPEALFAYPESLHSSLELLGRYHPKAVQVAERILENIKANSAKLEQQRAYLQTKIAECTDEYSTNLKQRLANLERCLQQNEPIILSEQRLERLRGKLQHASLHEFFTAWETNCLQALQAQLHSAFDLEQIPPEWLADTNKLNSLLALANLEPAVRRVVGLLCQAQLQGAYPLVTAPANQAWLSRMQKRGLNTQVWVDGLKLKAELQLNNKTQTIFMRFATTIFEVFRMGDHFQTCLSRGGVNFFSVVANAADINKRVLYFFDEQQQVIGRCLLAISDQGQLLRFYIYSHLPHKALEPCLQLFVGELVKQMGVSLGSTGRIAKLVANDWYDDGIESLNLEAEQAVFTRLSAQLERLTAENILTAVEQAFAPNTLNELGILSVLRWSALDTHFDLKLGLALGCLQNNLIGEAGLREVVHLLLFPQQTEINLPEKMVAIWPLAETWLWRRLREDILNTADFNRMEMDLLIQQQPWQALRVFRFSKRRLERRVGNYTRLQLDFYHAKTLITVRRFVLAQKILQQLSEEGYHEDDLIELRKACEDNLPAE